MGEPGNQKGLCLHQLFHFLTDLPYTRVPQLTIDNEAMRNYQMNSDPLKH